MDILDFAPEFTFNVDRVSEPEAGIPDRKAQLRFAMPKETDSRSLEILLPFLDASDFPIDNPSIRDSKAIAKEDCKITSQYSKKSSKLGIDCGIKFGSNAFKHVTT